MQFAGQIKGKFQTVLLNRPLLRMAVKCWWARKISAQ